MLVLGFCRSGKLNWNIRHCADEVSRPDKDVRLKGRNGRLYEFPPQTRDVKSVVVQSGYGSQRNLMMFSQKVLDRTYYFLMYSVQGT